MRNCCFRFVALLLAVLGCLLVTVPIAQVAKAGPITNDLFDISQGASVLSHSGVIPGFNPGDMFGQTVSTLEPGNVVFRDDMGGLFVHFIEWQTALPITLSSFNLFAVNDIALGNARAFNRFRLLAFDDVGFVVVHDQDIPLPYPFVGPDFLLISTALTPVTAQRFRAEFTQNENTSFRGPRVIELDGFGTVEAEPDHFLCYKAKTVGTEKFLPIPGVTLTDQFDTETVEVKKPVSLCNPAEKTFEGNTSPINDADTHLKGYQIKPATPHVPVTGIKVVNQFGELFVDTIKPDRLLVPSLKNLDNPVILPDPFEPNLDHYKCYKVKVSKGQPKFEPILGVSVSDQFIDADPNPPVVSKLFDLKKPRRLCNPVDKNGEGIKDDTAHLMCYQAKPASGQPKHVPVKGIFVNNQFGPEQLDTIKEEEFCVPSEKIVGGG